MTPSPPTLLARGLRKRYGDTAALDGFDLEVAPGTIHALLGPNGAGKTTAVRTFATLTRCDEGEVRVAGHDVRREPTAVRQAIGLVGQTTALDEVLFGHENLVLLGRLHGLSKAAAGARGDELLATFGIADAARPEGVDVLRRHAPPARHRRQPDPPPAAAVPRRADHRAGPARAGRGLAEACARSSTSAPRCC